MKSPQIKLANVLASYYGMKTQNPAKAKKTSSTVYEKA
ncbi:hypothetical protein NOELLE_208 [Vibrio phage Noelle]|nr:hypothetical protein NOELLE_13 [Vibrio phage Noelle]WBU77192.1 hypothetical protein NOELLE_208 [Vibrio phage Noelle]